ncbi:LBP_cg2779 family protein [Lactobacillus sp. PV034]|uniref:LBP_cg2779 family protein n=1 Tax=Lactobacillus sp. PV034 TaxID=2594495 RepID=UPI00223EF1E0|nr:LBP_cg2779 family protein [Lactobacillus sp. PV034]QNQ80396.1 hypothetical protein FP432_01925 [Lactobacillus sp. PV034]
MNPDELSNKIIEFEAKNDVTDSALAFASHLSVEKIHAMKQAKNNYTTEEVERILEYIQTNS